MDKSQHAQVTGVLFARREDEYALDSAPIVGFPGIGLPFRLGALGKDGVEASEGLELIGMQRISNEVNLSRFRDGRVADQDRT